MRLDHQTLTMKTVQALRALARENGIRIPAGSLKSRIIELIENGIREKMQKETEETKYTSDEAGDEKEASPADSIKEETRTDDMDMPLMKRANSYASNAPNYPTVNPRMHPYINAAVYPKVQSVSGVLEIMQEGYGFLRRSNFLPGKDDVYVSQQHIKRFCLRNGDFLEGSARPQRDGDKYMGLTFISKVNGVLPMNVIRRPGFDLLTPVYPQKRIRLETDGETNDPAIRLMDLISPVGKGQRGLIVSPPKAGKTTFLKLIARSILKNEKDIHLIMLLIGERPEEVTDIRREIKAECIYSTFDEKAENHVRISEMTLERAQRLTEMGKDVVILMDSITRLARAYNLIIPPTGRSLSGGLDPGALHKPKKFFGSARAIENGGSLTIIATALVDTGSRMDDIIYEEFKGTGNMEVHLDRRLSEKRIFPAMDIAKSGTRRDDLLLNENESACAKSIRKLISSKSGPEGAEEIISIMEKTKDNAEFALKLKGWAQAWQREGYHLL